MSPSKSAGPATSATYASGDLPSETRRLENKTARADLVHAEHRTSPTHHGARASTQAAPPAHLRVPPLQVPRARLPTWLLPVRRVARRRAAAKVSRPTHPTHTALRALHARPGQEGTPDALVTSNSRRQPRSRKTVPLVAAAHPPVYQPAFTPRAPLTRSPAEEVCNNSSQSEGLGASVERSKTNYAT